MIELTIFISTFVLVFALGFQSLNVNNGHYKAAFMTSFGIGVSNLVLFKTLPQADMLQIAAYLMGGPFGIICSMWAHKRVMKPKAPGCVEPPKPWPKPPTPVTFPEASTNWGSVEAYCLSYSERGDLLLVLQDAEAFIAGFEGDKSQEGIEEQLRMLRMKIAEINPIPQPKE